MGETWLTNPAEVLIVGNKNPRRKRRGLKRICPRKEVIEMLEETPRLDPVGFSRALREAWKVARTRGEAMREAWRIYQRGRGGLSELEETPRLDPAGFSRAMREAWKTARTPAEATRLAWQIYKRGLGEFEVNPRRRRVRKRVYPRGVRKELMPKVKRRKKRRVTVYEMDGIYTSPLSRLARPYMRIGELEENPIVPPLFPPRVELMDVVGAGIGLALSTYIPTLLRIPVKFKTGVLGLVVRAGSVVALTMLTSKVLKKPTWAKSLFVGGMAGVVAWAIDEYLLKGKLGISALGAYLPPPEEEVPKIPETLTTPSNVEAELAPEEDLYQVPPEEEEIF